MPRAAAIVLASITAGLLVGCDVEPGSAFEYDTVAHLDLDALRSSPWAKGMFEDGNIQISVDGSHDCEALVDDTDAVTLGTGSDRVEIYLEGSFSSKEVDACIGALEDDFAKKKTEKGEKPHKLKSKALGKGMFAVVIGTGTLPTPSRDRLSDLLDADPSPSDEPIWFTGRPDDSGEKVRYVEGWLNPKKGFDAHVGIEFADEATAAKTGAEATMFLTAMRLSDDTSEMAKAVQLDASGNTLSADVHASSDTMKAFMKASSMKASGKGMTAEEAKKHAKEHGKGTGSVSFSFGTE